MSFFIRKKQGHKDLSAPLSKENGRNKPKNSDVKKRPVKRDRNNDRRKGPRGNVGGGFVGPGGSKKLKYDPNEEIPSSSDDEDEGLSRKKRDVDAEDEEVLTAEDLETPQQKKIRLAQMYLEEIAKEERERKENELEDADASAFIKTRLHEDVMEAEGRLRREVSQNLKPDMKNAIILASAKYLKKPVTCLCVSPDDQFIYSACKDGNLFKWSLKTKTKVAMIKAKEKKSVRKVKNGKVLKTSKSPDECHSSAVLAIAISSDGKFLATGDMDKQIVIWDPEKMKKLHVFTGHRGPIRSLVFRKKTHTLYSSSDDRSVRIWSLDEMGYVETLFGHQDSVTCVDALSRERAISAGGRDNSIRVWKIVEESQLVYNGHYNGSIDEVKLINEENFLSCGDDGNLCTWNVNRKKPLFTVEKAHGVNQSTEDSEFKYDIPRWISTISALTNTDLVASGSSDGFIRFWKCGDRFKTLTPVCEVPCEGWINSMAFSHGSEFATKFLAAGVGKSHKLGRWFPDIKSAKNSIVIVPLSSGNELPQNGIESSLLNGTETGDSTKN